MSDMVHIRLTADSREKLAAAIALLERRGFDVRMVTGERLGIDQEARPGLRGEWTAYGTLLLYDTPEVVEAKFSSAVATARKFIEEYR